MQTPESIRAYESYIKIHPLPGKKRIASENTRSAYVRDLILFAQWFENTAERAFAPASITREDIYYGTFSLAASVGPSLAALILPFILDKYGYTAANPLGVRVAWLVAGTFAILGAVAFLGYKLGDTPEETRQNLGM